MKISKLLNKKSYLIVILIFFYSISHLYADDEPVDIWKLEKSIEENSSEKIIKEDKSDNDSIVQINDNTINKIEIIDDNKIEEKDLIVGLYDPDENGLKIDMWLASDGNEIKNIFNRINKIKLSKDANQILEIALLTNSYLPNKNINESEFIDFKIEYLIKKKDKKLIRNFLKKNYRNKYNSKLTKYYVDEYLINSDIKSACEIFEIVEILNDPYLNKFKIYCLINKDRKEEAQLLFDLLKETNFKDIFFEDKFNLFMGYSSKNNQKISEKTILDFHLSHRSDLNFDYKPSKNTPQYIWKYLSSANLLENIDTIDLEDYEKISLIEKATHENNYSEKELFNLYKRFQFNLNQLLNVREAYKLLTPSEGRALIYQRLLLSEEPKNILLLSSLLKDSFKNENIENAFNEELKKFLSKINVEDVPSNFSTFYSNNLFKINEKKLNIKINNKIIHQSKLLNYFKEKNEIIKIEKDTNSLLKSIKKNKKYVVSTKDLILLESLISDGVKISKKYQSLFEFEKSNIPTDIQLLISSGEIGHVLLRLVEIIGQDDLKALDIDTLYFMITILNKLNIDTIRNDILLKVLPLKV